MSGLELSLAAAALLIGATGTFSPCGFSAVETLGPTGHTGGRRTTFAALAAFVPGALIGGVLTFGALALIGEALHGAGGRVAYILAAAIAVVAAVLEARGTRIVPQIRRQLPEHWRRVMPMPIAAALYGVLLGLGFTTFVLTFGVWALAGISLAVGDPEVGLVLGIAFGVGRALPIVALAPLAGTPAGARATDLMAGDPGVYLGVRRGDAAVLAIAAVALSLSMGSAGAANNAARGATDPSVTSDSLAFQRTSGQAMLRRDGAEVPLPGRDPAVGGRYAAVRSGGLTRLFDRATLETVSSVATPNADAIAVSRQWLADRATLQTGGDGLFARDITDPVVPGPIQTIASIGPPAQLSPPSLQADVLLFAVARPKGSRIVQRVIGTRKRRTLVKSGGPLLFNPAVNGRSFVYTRSEGRKSRLMMRKRRKRGRGKVLHAISRRKGVLWSTDLTGGAAYVTILRPSATDPGARVIRVATKKKKKGKQKRKGRRKRR